MTYKFLCQECRSHAESIRKTTRFCSAKCCKKANNRDQAIKRAEARKGRVCRECGDTFNASFAHQVFCSKTCGRYASYARLELTHKRIECAHCKTEFETGYFSKSLYCSDKCRAGGMAANKAGRLEKLHEEGDKAVRKINCKHCNATVFTKQYRQKFCSNACRETHEAFEKARSRMPLHNTQVECIQCKETFIGIKTRSKFCSPDCRKTAYAKKQQSKRNVKRIDEHQHDFQFQYTRELDLRLSENTAAIEEFLKRKAAKKIIVEQPPERFRWQDFDDTMAGKIIVDRNFY